MFYLTLNEKISLRLVLPAGMPHKIARRFVPSINRSNFGFQWSATRSLKVLSRKTNACFLILFNLKWINNAVSISIDHQIISFFANLLIGDRVLPEFFFAEASAAKMSRTNFIAGRLTSWRMKPPVIWTAPRFARNCALYLRRLSIF